MRRALLSLFLSTVACTSGALMETEGETTADIIGGTTDDHDPAVVAISAAGTLEVSCSGTFIAPDVVLTAGHCPLTNIWVRQGPSVKSAAGHLAVRRSARHPKFLGEGKHYDVALLQLSTRVAGITPVTLSGDSLSSADVGTNIRHVGYGTTSDTASDAAQAASAGTKREVTYPITKVDDFFLWSGAPGKQTCSFDSGGPALRNDGVLIGIVSDGPDCESDGWDTRIDRDDILMWIDQQMSDWGSARP